ncbi:hypothetical protein RRG08_017282, partial [Elysia crispata]
HQDKNSTRAEIFQLTPGDPSGWTGMAGEQTWKIITAQRVREMAGQLLPTRAILRYVHTGQDVAYKLFPRIMEGVESGETGSRAEQDSDTRWLEKLQDGWRSYKMAGEVTRWLEKLQDGWRSYKMAEERKN